MDRPNSRSSHTVPTARGGGLAIVGVILAAMWVVRASAPTIVACLAVPTLILACISYLDDIRPISARTRLAIHFAVATVAVAWIYRLNTIGLQAMGFLGLGVVTLIALVWVAGYTNAFNFMDGINGIAGLQATIGGIGTGAIGAAAGLPLSSPPVLLSAVVAGAAAGFLPWNFPKASVFMGDVGSATLGYLLALLVIWVVCVTGPWLLIPLVCLHAGFFLDALFTLLRRWSKSEVLHQAHREHFYQRAILGGWSHPQVSVVFAAVQTATVAAAVLIVRAGPHLWTLLGALAGILGVWTAVFASFERAFNLAHRKALRKD